MAGIHFHLAGKRYKWHVGVFPISETFPISGNAAEFSTQWVISDIPANLSCYEISSDFRRISRLGRETFPSGLGTLHMDSGRFPDSGKRVPISETAAEFATQMVTPNFHIFKLIWDYLEIATLLNIAT